MTEAERLERIKARYLGPEAERYASPAAPELVRQMHADIEWLVHELTMARTAIEVLQAGKDR